MEWHEDSTGFRVSGGNEYSVSWRMSLPGGPENEKHISQSVRVTTSARPKRAGPRTPKDAAKPLHPQHQEQYVRTCTCIQWLQRYTVA